MLGLGYSMQRGFGNNHPFAGEIRMGEVSVEFVPEELGFAVDLGEITLSECQMVNQFSGSKDIPPQFTRGYGLAFGHSERKVMSMALVDRALKSRDLGEATHYPAHRTMIRPLPLGQCRGGRVRRTSRSCRITSISRANWS